MHDTMEYCLTENGTRCQLYPVFRIGANKKLVPSPDCIIPVPQNDDELLF